MLGLRGVCARELVGELSIYICVHGELGRVEENGVFTVTGLCFGGRWVGVVPCRAVRDGGGGGWSCSKELLAGWDLMVVEGWCRVGPWGQGKRYWEICGRRC